jgi:hypothetical protein
MNNAQHEIVKRFSLESLLGMWLDSVSQEHTKVVYCTYVLNASTKSMAKAYHNKCQSEKSKISQCLLRASKHHD